MSVSSKLIQWVISCDEPGCQNEVIALTSSSMKAMNEARQSGWHVDRDGTARCDKHC